MSEHIDGGSGVTAQPETVKQIELEVNSSTYSKTVEARRSLADFLREDLSLTGTLKGCEYGVCGTCTVLVDGTLTRSCITFAVQADGASVETVESFSHDPSNLHPIQKAFWERHGLQCGFCTPGMLITVRDMLEGRSGWTEDEIRHELSGSICRCTGYQHIVEAVQQADVEWER